MNLQFALATVLAGGIALVALRARTLTADGAVAAWLVGTAVFGAGGWRAAIVLLAFFVSSAALTRLGPHAKARLEGSGAPAARNWRQVAANGGVAAACILAARGNPALSAAFAGAFAAATADTWGTEIGTLSHRAPVSIVTFKRIAAGLSGGVTVLGSAATIAGALFAGAVATATGTGALAAVACGGVAGALVDSLIGGSLQALRWCPACATASEAPRHSCGTATTLRRGLPWMDNDAVNFAATLTGAAVAWAIAR